MQKLIDAIHAGVGHEHYLVKAMRSDLPYYAEFLKAGSILETLLSEKEFNIWMEEKMFLKRQPFLEKTFIQYAVETAVVRFFGERYPDNFQVEAKINPNNDKDVDCRFTDAGFIFNLEVKCSDFIAKEQVDAKDAFKYGTIGRLPDRGEAAIKAITSALDEGLRLQGKTPKEHVSLKNMDNNFKGFLELAHDKFNPDPSDREVNILVVGCDDAHDMQNWVNYLYAEQGLFTSSSFADQKKFQNVDLVVLTNQYYKHNGFFEKNVKNSWTLQHCFNVIMVNPFRHLEKTEAIRHFLTIIPNYGDKMGSYIVPGDAPDYVKNSVFVSHFIKDYLEDQNHVYLFEEKEK